MSELSCSVVFVDDDPKAGELMLRFCEGEPYACRVFADPRQALEHFRQAGADLLVTDLKMPGLNGIELLERVREADAEVPVIIITAHSTVDSAIEALRLGATDFIQKPFDMEALLRLIARTLEHTRLQRENQALRQQLRNERGRRGLIGTSAAMQTIHGLIEKVAESRCNVIVQGESGTGKELVARAIHEAGGLAERPFVVIDCGALSDTLLASELFGHEKGAFTGATQTRRGLLEVASGGTIFLDEIGNISDAMQIKLLRVIQEGQITRVGGTRPIRIDVRYLVATNRRLADLVRAGQFRADLYHRLNVVTIDMPPLRERREDIPLLVSHFVETLGREYGRDIHGFDKASLERLRHHDWSGNVRELRNLVERHIALADGPVLHVDELPGDLEPPIGIDGDLPTLAELERRYIRRVLDHVRGNKKEAAALLGIDKSTLWRRLRRGD